MVFCEILYIYLFHLNKKKKYQISVRFSVLSFLFSSLGKSKVLNTELITSTNINSKKRFITNGVATFFKNDNYPNHYPFS